MDEYLYFQQNDPSRHKKGSGHYAALISLVLLLVAAFLVAIKGVSNNAEASLTHVSGVVVFMTPVNADEYGEAGDYILIVLDDGDILRVYPQDKPEVWALIQSRGDSLATYTVMSGAEPRTIIEMMPIEGG